MTGATYAEEKFKFWISLSPVSIEMWRGDDFEFVGFFPESFNKELSIRYLCYVQFEMHLTLVPKRRRKISAIRQMALQTYTINSKDMCILYDIINKYLRVPRHKLLRL